MKLKHYQLVIIERGLSLLLANYDDYDLEDLMYSERELEVEIAIIQEKIKEYSQRKTNAKLQ
jgi:hypothetical protein